VNEKSSQESSQLPMSSYFQRVNSFWLVSVGWLELGARVTKIASPFLYLAASSSYFVEQKFVIEIAGTIVGFGAPLLRKLADYGNQITTDIQNKKAGQITIKHSGLSAQDKHVLKEATHTLSGKYFNCIFQIWHMSKGVLNFVNLINSWLAPTLSTIALGDFVSSTVKMNLQLSSIVIGFCSIVIDSISYYQPEAEARIINHLKFLQDYDKGLPVNSDI